MKSTYGTMYYVDNMKESVAFYKKMGFSTDHENDFWTEFDLSGHKLCLHAKKPNETYNPNGILIVNQDGLKTHFENMKKDGYNVSGLHEVHEGAWSFHLKDKSNNETSFYGKA